MFIIGRHVIELESTASTNDIAWQYAGDVSRHGLVVRADFQSAGRGQRGNRWIAPPGSCLMMSILLQHRPAFTESYQYTLWSAISICHLVQNLTQREPHLKWPNDVQLEGRKLCGILVERRANWIVVGMGLNVNLSQDYLEAASYSATSLNQWMTGDCSPRRIMREALPILDAQYQLLVEGRWQALQSAWQQFSHLLNKPVELTASGRKYRGTLHTLEWNEIHLLLNGNHASFHPASVSELRCIPQTTP
jgi:BirA family biotin operon repressor/biotin-[acetyl-CoA-carboxylase] ligase